ncbi:MAG: hypothetical protein ACR2MB_17215 [Acidimicrobiales bacterium]
MPSSSSAKKVARVAARSGGKPTSGASAAKQRNWLFGLAIVAIVAVGLGVLVFARNKNQELTSNSTKPRAQVQQGKPFDHWHSAFAINVCGKELPPIPQPATDTLGIHTHGDGLIHIHPFTVNAAGKRATMARFWGLVKLKVNDTGFKDPTSGKVYQAGKTTCGGKPTELVLAYWKDGTTAATSKPDKIYTSNFPGVRFTKDLSAYTLALVAKGDRQIAAPKSSSEIVTLGACDGAHPPPSCSPGSAPATPSGDGTVQTVPAPSSSRPSGSAPGNGG